MDNSNVITEKSHPIQTRWVIKHFVIWGLVAIVNFIIFYGFYLPSHIKHTTETFEIFFLHLQSIFVVIVPIILPITGMLIRNTYHYEFGKRLITLKQGIISKSERHVPYGRIQNIFLTQGFIDRLIGLASIAIETASDSGGAKSLLKDKKNKASTPGIIIGFSSNRIAIPGLLYEDALNLKEAIATFIKSNPIDDAQSGL